MTNQWAQLTILGVTGRRKETTPAAWRDAFIERVKTARGEMSREDVVSALRIKVGPEVNLERYKRYETRSLLPHHWIIPFCEVTGADVFELLSGRPFSLRRTTRTTNHLTLVK